MALDDNPFDSGTADAAPAEAAGSGPEPVAMDIGAIVTRAWELFTDNIGIVAATILIPVGVSLVFAVPSNIAQTVARSIDDQSTVMMLSLVSLALSLTQIVVSMYLQLGATRIYTNLAFGRAATVSMLFGEAARLPGMLLSSLLVGIGVVLGFVLLVVPGVILGLGLELYVFALVDQGLGPVEALQESWRLTDGYKVFLFLIGLVLTVVAAIIIVFTCGFGLVAVAPTLALVQAVIYHTLVSEKGRAATAAD
jgi:uncharacterized membrane protein